MLQFTTGQLVHVRFSPSCGLWEGYTAESDDGQPGWFEASCVATDATPPYLSSQGPPPVPAKHLKPALVPASPPLTEESPTGVTVNVYEEPADVLKRGLAEAAGANEDEVSHPTAENSPTPTPNSTATATPTDISTSTPVPPSTSKSISASELGEAAVVRRTVKANPKVYPSNTTAPNTPAGARGSTESYLYTPKTSARSSGTSVGARTTGVDEHVQPMQLFHAASTAWMQQQSWYVGDMSRDQIKWWGTNLSQRGPKGGFMVRIPESKPTCLALMVKVADGKIKNFLIKRVEGGYRLNSTWAHSMEELVQQLSKPNQNVLPVPLLCGFFLKKHLAERKATLDRRSRILNEATSVGHKRGAASDTHDGHAGNTPQKKKSRGHQEEQPEEGVLAETAAAVVPKATATAAVSPPRLADVGKATSFMLQSNGLLEESKCDVQPAADLSAEESAAVAAEDEEALLIAAMYKRLQESQMVSLQEQEGAESETSATLINVEAQLQPSTATATADAASTQRSESVLFDDEAVILSPPHVHLAAHGYTSQKTDELTFATGSTITVTEKPEGGWWKGSVEGREGWFPCNHIAGTSQTGDPAPDSAVRDNTVGAANELVAEEEVDLVEQSMLSSMLWAPPPGFAQ
jgi:hypothetical protein